MYLNTSKKISKGFDVRLIIYFLVLVLVGWATIYSTCYHPNGANFIFDFSKPYGKQLVWIGTSLLLATAILFIDKQLIRYSAYIFYFICLILMVSVLFIGTNVSGAKAWIKIGGFSIQPTEFMKMATALALARFFHDGKTTFERRNIWLIALGIIALPVVIIMLQHDTGSALVFASFFILFYREGMSGKLLLVFFIAAFLAVFTLYFNEIYAVGILMAVFIFLFIKNRNRKKAVRNHAVVCLICIAFVFSVNIVYENVFEPHQKMRIDTLLGKTSDPQGADYNLNQSKIAIGSGGLFGKGYLKGTQTKLDFVPEQSTDFIFCGIGEEWGFMGTIAVFALFGALVLRILSMAEKQQDLFVRYYGYGIAGIIAIHFFINIGMTIGLMPIIGIPLPFISYGGSSLWAFTLMLFTFIRLNDD